MPGLRSGTIGLISALLFVGRIVSGQLPSPGDRDPSGRVLAKLTVTITEPNAYGHPVAGLRFLVVAENGDRISVRTDEAGAASAWLPAGPYRFVTPDPLTWQCVQYTWDVLIPIRAGTGVIRLSQENATKVVAAPTEPLGPVIYASPVERPVTVGGPPFQYKDGTTATLLSLLIIGGGQIYAGETGKGLIMLLGSAVAIGVGYAASNCGSYGCETTGPLVGGYVFALGMWVYSLADAHNAAARHNARAPRTAIDPRIIPVVELGAQRTTHVGINFRY
jgi:TM2 domain-containing membrane protein YozV